MEVIKYILIFIAAIAIYFASNWMLLKIKIKFLHPIILSTAMTIFLLVLTKTPYETYHKATQPISWLLGPSIVSLGWVMYNHIKELKHNLKLILLTTFLGSTLSIVMTISLARLFNLPNMIERSVVPKSITTPIAMQVSDMIGGNPSITIAVVVLTGVSGVLMSPILYRWFNIKDPIAQGLGLGCASHAIGTASALEIGALQGAVSGMAIGVMGIFTAIIAPLVYSII